MLPIWIFMYSFHSIVYYPSYIWLSSEMIKHFVNEVMNGSVIMDLLTVLLFVYGIISNVQMQTSYCILTVCHTVSENTYYTYASLLTSLISVHVNTWAATGHAPHPSAHSTPITTGAANWMWQGIAVHLPRSDLYPITIHKSIWHVVLD